MSGGDAGKRDAFSCPVPDVGWTGDSPSSYCPPSPNISLGTAACSISCTRSHRAVAPFSSLFLVTVGLGLLSAILRSTAPGCIVARNSISDGLDGSSASTRRLTVASLARPSVLIDVIAVESQPFARCCQTRVGLHQLHHFRLDVPYRDGRARQRQAGSRHKSAFPHRSHCHPARREWMEGGRRS